MSRTHNLIKLTIFGLKQQVLDASNVKSSIQQPTKRTNKTFSSGNQYPKTTPSKTFGEIKISTRINEVVVNGRDTFNDVYTPILMSKPKGYETQVRNIPVRILSLVRHYRRKTSEMKMTDRFWSLILTTKPHVVITTLECAVFVEATRCETCTENLTR